MKKSALVTFLAAAPMFITPAFADREGMNPHDKWIHESAATLHEIMDAGDRSIPEDLIRRSQCVVIVPNLKRAGLILGAKYGKGIMTCRTTAGWSAPAIMRIEGGSIGLQIGAGETDIVMLVMNESGKNKLLRDKFTVGADAAVMAGPVGRNADAATDAAMHAELLAWSRSRGLFGGVTLEGATLRPDNDDNAKLYGRPLKLREIVNGDVRPPASASEVYSELDRFPFREH